MQRQAGNGYIKKIDFVFYRENDIKRAVNEVRQDSPCRGLNGSGVADPTAAQAMRNVTPLVSVEINGEKLEWPEHWLKVISATYGWCDNDRFIIAHDRYSGVDYRQTCAKLSISEKTYYNYLGEVRNHAAICAAQLGLIKVC